MTIWNIRHAAVGNNVHRYLFTNVQSLISVRASFLSCIHMYTVYVIPSGYLTYSHIAMENHHFYIIGKPSINGSFSMAFDII